MTNTREIILTLKEVYAERKRQGNPISYDQIRSKMIENGDYPIAKSSISRVLKKAGSENEAISYENILRPIAKVLLDIETIEAEDDVDTRGYKSIINFKKELLFEYEEQLERYKKEVETLKAKLKDVEQREKSKYHEKLERETQKFQENLAFLNKQVDLKDERIDQLLHSNTKLLDQFLACPHHCGVKEEK